jgi:tRNA (guanosine-2'-O-)-methyltransferase
MNDKRRDKIQFCADHRQSDFTVLMEDVQDNHNFGAVLRTCDAVGIYQAFLLQHRNLLPRKGFILGKRSSMGSRKWVDVLLYKNANNCIDRLKKEYLNIYTAMPGEGSKCLYDLDLTQPFVMVFGNETQGISKQVLECVSRLCNRLIRSMSATQSGRNV